MAGITAVYSRKGASQDLPRLVDQITRYHKLSGKEVAFTKSVDDTTGFGVVSIKSPDNHAKHFSARGIDCLVEGTVFIHKNIRESLKTKYQTGSPEEESLLPWLWLEYGEQSWRYINGWFNWLIHDAGTGEIVVMNDRFGMLPCYYTENNSYLAIASKFSSFIIIGITPANIDSSSLLQYMAFAFPIADRSYIRGIRSLPAASILKIGINGISVNKYWDFAEFLNRKGNTLSKKESLPFLFDSLRSVHTRLSERAGHFAVSLTGGWDGRLVLSFLDSMPKDCFFLYSFGTECNEDIIIPRKLAADLGYDYRPVLLDDSYLSSFTQTALDTLRNSDGLRPISRTQYLYSAEFLGRQTNHLFSGNCGSNILKSIVKPSSLYNRNVLRLFGKQPIQDTVSHIFDEMMDLEIIRKDAFNRDEFVSGVVNAGLINDPEMDEGRKFYHFLISVIERKYFGVEISSYSHHLYNFSPFIDFEFIDAVTQTPFFGGFTDFRSAGRMKIFETSRLYGRLIGRNSRELAEYPTNRGFALADLESLPGLIPASIKYIKNRKLKVHGDNFNFRNAIRMMNKKHPGKNTAHFDLSGMQGWIEQGRLPESLVFAYSFSTWLDDLNNRTIHEGSLR